MNLRRIHWTYIVIAVVILLACIHTISNNPRASLDFPPTMVINLDSRSDRLKEFRTQSWPVPIERISAVQYNPGWKGCFASHYKCVRLAKERNYPWVVIVEDDCMLTPTAISQFQILLPYLWKNRNRWDIFYGGVTSVKNPRRISHSPPLYETYAFAAHFCLIHTSTYDKILNGCPQHISEYKEPVDVYYAKNFRIWTTTPFFAKQRSGKSDIENGKVDYTDMFADAENALRTV